MKIVKKHGKSWLSNVLEWQVKRLRKKHEFTVVGVVGSVGKTSTKMSIARLLGRHKHVRFQEGNYNDRLTVPLVFFGHKNPNMFNIFAWVKIFISNETQIIMWDHDVVVVELGTDEPGQIIGFEYVKPELVVVTAITPEHMLQFGSLDAVAKEELTVAEFSRQILINADDTDDKYLDDLIVQHDNVVTFGLDKKTDYGAELSEGQISITGPEYKFQSEAVLLGKQGAKTIGLSVVASHLVGIKVSEADVKHLKAFNGRMNLLPGINNSTIIDDSYNASPAAVTAALDVVYATHAEQKIAILGTMNELGDHEEDSHREIGKYCDPKQLDLVVTIGEPAEKFLAEEAKNKGCEVKSFKSPFDAGEQVAQILQEGALVLVKGSQNRVFAEESIKFLLADPEDKKHLVRQSNFWLKEKQKQFGRRID